MPLIQRHRHYMQRAYQLAEQAFEEDEVPVGAVVVHRDRIIGKGYNQVERLHDPTAHAEILAISAACDTLKNKFLNDCTLYVTLEPCPMCAGALVWSRIDRIVFAVPDEKAGACGTLFNIPQNENLNHRVELIQGLMEAECEALLKDYFRKKRSPTNGSQ